MLNSSEKTNIMFEPSRIDVLVRASSGVSRSIRPKFPIEGTCGHSNLDLAKESCKVLTCPVEFVPPKLEPIDDHSFRYVITG